MSHDWAYLNDKFIPAAELYIAPTDSGFLQGTTVAEQLRTFQGRLFRLENHLQRLMRSLAIVGVNLPRDINDLTDAANHLAAHNHSLLDPADDLGLTIFVTPGTYSSYLAPGETPVPQVGMHTTPLAFRQWANKYEQGDALCLTDIRQVPNNCWPAELKVRSRVHYYLADKQARQRFPGSRAVLLDQDGFVMEGSTANLLVVHQQEGIISPPRDQILPGVSVATVEEIARCLQIPFTNRPVTPLDLASADELLLCSTSPCLWPVLSYEGAPVGQAVPGPVFRQLLDGWSTLVGFDIPAQAQRFSIR